MPFHFPFLVASAPYVMPLLPVLALELNVMFKHMFKLIFSVVALPQEALMDSCVGFDSWGGLVA